MVSISKLLNGGILLVGQNQYSDLATPQQAADDAYNIANFLGGSGPFVQRQGYGIDTAIPGHCTLEQVQLLSRHGERYPSASNGEEIEELWAKLQTKIGSFTGDLAFFNDNYQFFITNDEYLDQETSPKNSESIYAGTTKALKDGAAARLKYNDLVVENATFPVFTSNSHRCYETSRYFMRGFLGDDYSDDLVDYVVIDEDTQGANTLTPRHGCANYSNDSDEYIEQYDTTFLSDISSRLSNFSQGLNFSDSEVLNFFDWCAYELNVKGSSKVCDLFSNEEFIRQSYYNDIDNYYSNGPGNQMNLDVGSVYLNSSLRLLQDESANNKIWLSFSHDTDLEIFLAALGIIAPQTDLPTDHIQFPYQYQHAQIVPQSAKIYTEKYSCDGTSYIRYIMNDAVVPISTCASGPGFSCNFNDYEEYVEHRIGNVNFNERCNNNASLPNEVSFYWDYNTTEYNAALGNF